MAYEVVTRTLRRRRYGDGNNLKNEEASIVEFEPDKTETAINEKPVIEETTIEEPAADLEEVEPFSFDEEEHFTIEEPSEEAKSKKINKEKKKRRRLQIYEPVDEEELKMKQHIENAINYDGYYNEIRPRDDGEKIIKERKKIKLWQIGVIAGMLIFSIAMMAYGIGSFGK